MCNAGKVFTSFYCSHDFIFVSELRQSHVNCEYSHKTSTEENIEDGKKWMRDEVKLCLKKHIEKTPHHKVTVICLCVVQTAKF